MIFFGEVGHRKEDVSKTEAPTVLSLRQRRERKKKCFQNRSQSPQLPSMLLGGWSLSRNQKMVFRLRPFLFEEERSPRKRARLRSFPLSCVLLFSPVFDRKKKFVVRVSRRRLTWGASCQKSPHGLKEEGCRVPGLSGSSSSSNGLKEEGCRVPGLKVEVRPSPKDLKRRSGQFQQP